MVTLALMIVAVFFIFSDQVKDKVIQQKTEKYALTKYTTEQLEENQEAEAIFDFDQVVAISTEEIAKAQLVEDNAALLGGITVPSVGINLPIFKGVAYNLLFYGAGTTSPNQAMGQGNYGLASHKAMDRSLLFSPLDDVRKGEMIYLSDLVNIYCYEIYSIEIVVPENISILEEVEGKAIVTLITCSDGTGTKRLIVQGELQEIVSVENAPHDVRKAFNFNRNKY